MTPISKLDGILKVLASQYPVNKEYLFIDLSKDEYRLDLIAAELFFIIDKLKEDGYVKIRHSPEKSTIEGLSTSCPYYSITFKGAYFILSKNGYTGQAIRENEEAVRVEKLEVYHIELNEKLNALTRWVAIGAVGLVVWEIIKTFLIEHHFFG